MTQKRRLARRTGVRRLIPHSLLPLTLALTSFLVATVLVLAADSDLDPSFDGDGIVTTNHDEFDQINDIVIQPDGKIVVAGDTGFIHILSGSRASMTVARYNVDGSLDATFGNNGTVVTSVGEHSLGNAITLQQDGKIVVAGRGDINGQARFAVVRYNADGSLDGTFGNGGVVTTSIGTFAFLTGVAIQSDGKIVASGSATGPGPLFSTFTVARYNTDGSLDATFDGDGVTQAVPAGFSFSPMVTAWGMALQQDQRIVVVGDCNLGALTDFCVSRYNSDGSLDSTFDGDGLVITSFDATSGSTARDVVVQPNGKILAAGSRFVESGLEAALARYNDDGSPDITFDGDGRVTTASSQFHASAIALQSDGKIVAVGDSADLFVLRITVARYHFDGSLDNTFGSGGIVTTPIGTLTSQGNAVAVQTDGNIVAGGFANFNVEGAAFLSDFALVRYGEPANRAPVVTMTGPPSGSVFAVNTPVDFTGSFSDDTNDAHSVVWRFIAAPQPGPAEVAVSSATPGPFTTTHTFTQPGVYKVTLIVLDNELLSGIANTVNGVEAIVVVYDPNGSWVSGGGWIDSPPGAFATMPAETGKANFAFVARYHDGANVPTGNMQFQFSAGDLNFQSTGFDWLVVSGPFALCKGTGTINGGNYRFMLTTIDGNQPGAGVEDRVRIRIWSDSEGLVYDNQLNGPETDAPTTALGGGSITFHR